MPSQRLLRVFRASSLIFLRFSCFAFLAIWRNSQHRHSRITSLNFNTMSQAASPTSVSYHTTTFTASFESFNRGPITTLFVPPTTCNQLLTSAVGTLFLGHFGPNYFDPACYPAGTIPESSLEVQTNWGLYYYEFS